MPFMIYIYSMMGLLICKNDPFWQKVSVESYTQVTVKLVSLLLYIESMFVYEQKGRAIPPQKLRVASNIIAMNI